MTPYPPTLPPDLDDLTAVAAHDWAAFQCLDHVDTHWRRPGWTDGRTSYHWMLTFGGCRELADHTTRLRHAVPAAGYDFVDATALHLTIGRVGFTDELTERQALDAAAAAHGAAFPPKFGLAFGPLTGSRGAIRYSVAPWSSLLAVHAALTDATRAVLGRQCVMDTATFRPHVSIAYAHTRLPTAVVVNRLRAWRSVVGPTVPIVGVDLVRLQRVGRTYCYDTIAAVPLGAVRPLR